MVFMPKRLTYREVKDFIEKTGYTLLSEDYVNSETALSVKCDKDHDAYDVRFSNFKTGKRCPTCAIIKRNESKRIDPSVVKKEVEDNGYSLLEIKEGSKGNHKRLIVKCDKDHDAYEVTFQNFKKGRRCPYCKAEKKRTPIEDVIKNVEAEGFELVSGEYQSRKSKMVFRCPKKHEYPSTYDSFLAGKRCGRCSGSRGENLINFILESVLIENSYIYQHGVDINNKTYRFDFSIDAGKTLYIEYDGIQHYKPVARYGGVAGFKEQQERDKVKNDYVDRNDNFEILRIPYFLSYESIYYVLMDFLKRQGVVTKPLDDLTLLAKAAHTSQDRVRLIAEHYLVNDLEKTMAQFSVHRATVYKYFKQFFGVSRLELLN